MHVYVGLWKSVNYKFAITTAGHHLRCVHTGAPSPGYRTFAVLWGITQSLNFEMFIILVRSSNCYRFFFFCFLFFVILIPRYLLEILLNASFPYSEFPIIYANI
jgi:hypothetical protein